MNIIDKKQITGNILIVFLLLALINSAYFFLSVVKLSTWEWLAFNSCSLAIIGYLICFVFFKFTKQDVFLAVALLPLYYYGTMGLFVVPWNLTNIFAHITHVVITLNVVWVLYMMLKEYRYESLGKGLLIGVILFVPIFAAMQSYSQLHMAEIIETISDRKKLIL